MYRTTLKEVFSKIDCRFKAAVKKGVGYVSIFCTNADEERRMEAAENAVREAGATVTSVEIVLCGFHKSTVHVRFSGLNCADDFIPPSRV